MKKLLALSLVLFCSANIAFAQSGGVIGLFSDTGGVECSVFDTPQTGFFQVFVVHTLAPGWMCAAFSVPIPACALGVTWLGDTQTSPGPPGPKIGFSPTGVSLCSGLCQSTPAHFLTITYLGEGLSENCCPLTVRPPEGVGASCGVITDSPCMVDCAQTLFPAGGGVAIINPDATCPCTVAVEESTWGKVKSLYKDE